MNLILAQVETQKQEAKQREETQREEAKQREETQRAEAKQREEAQRLEAQNLRAEALKGKRPRKSKPSGEKRHSA